MASQVDIWSSDDSSSSEDEMEFTLATPDSTPQNDKPILLLMEILNGHANEKSTEVFLQTHPEIRDFLDRNKGPQSTEYSLEKLSVDLSKLYNTGEDSDISLKCGDRTIPAHKTVLSARSDVFAAMFRNDMLECQEGIVNVQDIEFPILDLLLRYIYSGKVDVVSGDTAVQLYKAADKYAVDLLKRKCALSIVTGLTEDTACDYLVLADMHSDQDMKDSVISCILKKEGFLLSSKWREFSTTHSALAVEVYDAFVRDISSK